jgi:hypothetical protein
MTSGFGENVLHHAPGQPAGALVLFLDDFHLQAGAELRAVGRVHSVPPFSVNSIIADEHLAAPSYNPSSNVAI